MEKTINENLTLGQVAAIYPHVKPVLENLGLDFCCGGNASLKSAAQEKSLDIELVLSKLQEAISVRQPETAEQRDWTTASLTELCDYIEQRHHSYMRNVIPRISGMLIRVKRAHGTVHGSMLVELEDTFISLKEEIQMHLLKEERVLFPYIRQIEAYSTSHGEMPEAHCGTVANPIRQMEHEHDNAGSALKHMRQLTNGYTLPADGCETFKDLYCTLDEMEKDLHEHIHLENSILFPRAIELENNTGICQK